MTRLAWRKSRRSAESGCCVEVAELPDAVLVRDSKNPNGPHLTFNRANWTAFVDGVKTGELAAS